MPDSRNPRRQRPVPQPDNRDESRKPSRPKRRSARDRGRARARVVDISDVRKLTAGEREIVWQVGQFRSVAQADFVKHLPVSLCDSPARTIRTLKELGLVRSHYVRPHTLKLVTRRDAEQVSDTRLKNVSMAPKTEIIVLTHKGAAWLRANGYDESSLGKLRPGLAKSREAFHDSRLYAMTIQHMDKLKAEGATNFRVLTDSALKEALYKERAQRIKDGRTEEQAHIEAAELLHVPLSDGKYNLPDVRVEYEMPDGSRSHVDLELISGTYSKANIAAKNAAGFVSYALNNSGQVERGGGTPWDEDWMARSWGR